MKLLPIFLLLMSPSMPFAQPAEDSSARFDFLPAGLHFAPLKASTEEARIGVFKFLDASQMKVDIGNSIDVFGVKFARSRLTAGIDFFAYAFVTGAQGLRLQIDAIDGFFGGNLTFSHDLCDAPEQTLYLRLRVLHQSAHFVDGHFLPATNSWIDNRQPIPFTRDFGELLAAHRIASSYGLVRYYAGISYASLIRPDDIGRISYLTGAEVSERTGSLWDKPANLYLSYNLTINGTPAYAASHQVQAGIKFGGMYEKGPSLFVMYHTGRHMFAEYFDERLSTFGAGFTMDFF